jgi:photosystem II stability/assembly factor-like uncharacterized protein
MISMQLYVAEIHSQDNWTWINPLPQGNSLRRVTYLNENTFFCYGSAGTMLKTTNAGTNWNRVHTNINSDISSVSFINGTTGFAGGTCIIKTTDGGENWYMVNPNKHGFCYFLNNNTGFIVHRIEYPPPTNSAGLISKSFDGGISWNDMIFPLAMWLNTVDFRNNIGITGGLGFDGSRFFRTTDYGNSWFYNNQLNSGDIQCIKFITDSIVIASGHNGIISKSTDKGITWNIITNSIPIQLNDLKFININSGIVAGSHGSIVITTNAGVNWQIVQTEINNEYFGIELNQYGKGVVCGPYGVLYLSSDFGLNWYNNYRVLTRNYCRRVFAFNRDSALILADTSILLKTTDGGVNWVINEISANHYIYDISFINMNTGLASGVNGSVYKTTNAGNDWIQLTTSTSNFLSKVFMVDENTAYIRNNYSEIIKTTNGGVSWSVKTINYSFSINTIYFLNPLTGYCTGTGETIVMTTDGGDSWVRQHYNSSSVVVFSSIDFVNSTTGFVTCDAGKIYKTTNSGTNWDPIQVAANNIPVGPISMANEKYGFLGISPDIYYTSNYGNNWIKQNISISSTLRDLYCIDSITAIAVGLNGMILGNNFGINVGIKNINYNVPSDFVLSQNYPNPFNPVTRIKFDIPPSKSSGLGSDEGMITRLIIYDVLSREVSTLVNQELTPGTYEVVFDASNYPSGVYFYRLAAGDFTQTKKMVLLK